MGADEHLCRATIQQEPDGGQRGADPGVVGDLPVVERDVEVGAQQDALAGDVGVADRTRPMHLRKQPAHEVDERHE